MKKEDKDLDESSEDDRKDDRRALLTRLGLAAGAAVAVAMSSKFASADIPSADIQQASLEDLKTALLDSNRKPASTGIAGLRLSSDSVALLSPAARKLTKGDLLALGQKESGANVALSANAAAISAADLKTIRAAFFHNAAEGGGAGGGNVKKIGIGDIKCCCCCPCCCAAAVAEPRQGLVA